MKVKGEKRRKRIQEEGRKSDRRGEMSGEERRKEMKGRRIEEKEELKNYDYKMILIDVASLVEIHSKRSKEEEEEKEERRKRREKWRRIKNN